MHFAAKKKKRRFLWALCSAAAKGLSLSARDPVAPSMKVRASGEHSWPSWDRDNAQRTHSAPPMSPSCQLHTLTALWHQSSGNRAGQSRMCAVCSSSLQRSSLSLPGLCYIIRLRTAGSRYLDNRSVQWRCIQSELSLLRYWKSDTHSRFDY